MVFSRQAAENYGTPVLEDDSSGGGFPHQVKHNERWTEDLFGEGPVSWQSHVVVPKEWLPKIPPPLAAEQEMIEYIPAMDRTPTSRLATEIVLTKELDGLVFFLCLV